LLPSWHAEVIDMHRTHRMIGCLLVAALFLAGRPEPAAAASAKKIAADASAALQRLYASTPAAKGLGAQAKAILVFPSILKAGFMVGAQGGNGALRKRGKTVAYYSTAAASYGFQAGVQSFSYALFLMTDSAVEYLDHSGGWELGTGPSGGRRRGRGEVAEHDHAQERRLRVRLRAEGAHGRHRDPGVQDHPHPSRALTRVAHNGQRVVVG
jgi:hypothetical protein